MAVKKPKKTAAVDEKDFSVYLGPTIRGVITQGQIFDCPKEQAVEQMRDAVNARPLIESLIVRGSGLPEARKALQRSDSLLRKHFNKLATGQD